MEEKPKVCVIGAGLAGLTSTKCMLDVGFTVKCFEKENHVGGRWHPNNKNAIPRGTVTNVPQYMSCFSDFPMPEKYPLYMTADQFWEYFDIYANHFNLLNHILLNTEVLSVVPVNCSEDDNNMQLLSTTYPEKWIVDYRKEDGTTDKEKFDFVVVSSGFYSIPYIPEKFKAVMENFSGKVIHSVEYQDWKPFENQKVVVCGLGNTGGDIASEVADHCKQAYISTSKGSFIIPRIYQGGTLPLETAAIRLAQYLPNFVRSHMRKVATRKIANSIYSMEQLHLTPKSISSTTANDEIGLRISSGKLKVRAGIKKANGKTIYFEDGKIESDVDAIILCTGYKRSFPFFSEDVIQIEKNGKYIPLYKGIFTPKYRSRLAFICMTSVIAPFPFTAEMQVRYAAEVFKKNIILPTKLEMERIIRTTELQIEAKMGKDMKEYNFILNPWGYYDELAQEIGCRPSIIWLLITDPQLAWHLIGRYNIFEYRLVGPNSWPGAREEIIKKAEKMYAFMNE